ncbi:MAG TPA: hypothetical protein VJJ52_01325 [Candidatus Nanoarchaeia archaeon]|nr:hypothetical protein [Candidatus Nanoarchaeia archaeon]
MINPKIGLLQDGHAVRLQTEDYVRVFTVIDGPIVPGGKYQTRLNTREEVDGLDHRNRSGGSGYNSAKANARISRPSPVRIKYIDSAEPNHINTERLEFWGIDYKFLGKRQIQFNVVVGYDGDKIIIKGPLKTGVQLDSQSQSSVFKFLRGADGILINSIKDEEFAMLLIKIAKEMDIPVYFGATSSPSIEFSLTQAIPNGPTVTNYEDIARMNNLNPQELVNLSADKAIAGITDLIKTMQRKGIFHDYPFVVTLGGKGMIPVASNKEMRHVRMAQPFADRVDEHLKTDLRGSLGGGDYFTGGLYDQFMQAFLGPDKVHPSNVTPDDLETMVRQSNIVAIDVMRYQGPAPSLSSFDSKRL